METQDQGSISIEDKKEKEENSLENQVVESKEASTESKAQAESDEELKDTFASIGVPSQICESLESAGWTKPTPIQVMCLPECLKGNDVVGFAQTGTGKTGVFLISAAHVILKDKKSSGKEEKVSPKAFVLAPTRELAIQIDNDCKALFKDLDLTSVAVYGGADYEKQEAQLGKGVDIIIGTPGRLKDFYDKGDISLAKCKHFICDEADRMFDMGFIEDVEFFLDKVPSYCQKLLFSATSNDHVKELAFEYLEKPIYLYANPETLTPEKINQKAYICEAKNKLKVLLGMLEEYKPTCSVIFVNTKLVAEWLQFKLENNGVSADLITGDLPQKKRIALISKIKKGNVTALIATDVVSRGLHISSLTHVFNFDLPDDPANYVHRIGRTARAGQTGTAISFVCEDYGQNLHGINKILGEDFEVKADWHEEKYLEVEDKAPNPYKVKRERSQDDKRDYSSSSQGRDDRAKRPDDRPRSQDRSNNRPDRSERPQRNPRDKKFDKNEPNPRNRNPSKGNNPRGGRDYNREGGRPSQDNYKKPNNRPKGKFNQMPPQQEAAKPQSGSVFGMLKKAVKTIFGGK